jgi:Vitamin K-dependent gamma-carboxylase
MSIRNIAERLEAYFFAPQSPLPIACFRILHGLCVLMTVILLHSDWLDWFGVHGWISPSTMSSVEPGIRLNLFAFLPQDDRWIQGFFWFFVTFTVLLTLGLWSRVSSVIVFLCLASIQQRNLLIIHSGDTFLRVTGFFLMFAPSGAALSVDRLIRVRRHKQDTLSVPKSPWAQRMIQFELALVYFCAFWWKAKGHTWWDGTAIYYVTHLDELRRFPLPGLIQNPVVLKLISWFVLALELALGVLLWFRPFRYPLLLLGFLFHATLEYATNTPMFQWDILSAYVLFIDPADLQRVINLIQHLPARALAGRGKTRAFEGAGL